MKYVALLRGINVGGNNIVSMSQLKHCFEDVGFENVVTYINSGNILFETPKTSTSILVEKCEKAIKDSFGFHVVCCVIATDDLIDAYEHAPLWWNRTPGDKHNVLFVIAPATAATIMSDVGEAKPEYEQVASYGNLIFWTAPLKTFGRTRYSKIVSSRSYQYVTIRNANTVKKLVTLASTAS